MHDTAVHCYNYLRVAVVHMTGKSLQRVCQLDTSQGYLLDNYLSCEPMSVTEKSLRGVL
jgi:hypothetical protein